MAAVKLTVEGASFAYRRGVPVIEDLNMRAESGQLVAVLGPNGAGKTTLLRCLMGFLSWNAGRALLDGEDISIIPERRLRSRISYVPQARGNTTSLPAEDMILLGRTGKIGIFSSPGEADRKIARRIAEELGISGLLGKRCSEMSGGEFQMVLIARALAGEPELLILDEPESNLDFRNQLIVLEALSRLAREGMAVIFNTHYPEHALTRADRSLIMKKGGGSLFGETAEVVTEENIEEAFGVEAVIREFETPGNVYRSILPLRLSKDGSYGGRKDRKRGGRSLAVISVIFRDYELAGPINALFHEYRDCLAGRMGMPCGEYHVINVILNAPEGEILSLTDRLTRLDGVRVKATAAPEGGEF